MRDSVGRVDDQDPRLEPYRQLKDTNLTRWARQFVVEGEKLVLRLLASRHEVVSVLVDERSRDRLPESLPAGVDLIVLPAGAVAGLVGFNFHRGMLACARRPVALPLGQVVGESPECQTWLVCPQLEDPENLGSILRIGAAFGVQGVLTGDRCPDAHSRRVLRVSMGAALTLPVVRSADLGADLDRLGSWGFERVATVLDPTAESLARAPRRARLALLLGSEGHGLDQRWVEACDRRVSIEMNPGVDSLNVAVATGICLYHYTRVAKRNELSH